MALVLFVVYVTVRRNICDAIWCCWWFSLAMPTHSARYIHSLMIDLRLITSVALLAALVFSPRGQFPKLRLTLTDLLVAGLFISFNVSPLLAEEYVPLGVITLARVWVLPYFFGRIAGQSPDSLDRVMPFLVSICVVLSIAGVFEAVTRINVLNHLFSHWAYTETRWGFLRASVNVAQPIPFGLMIVLMSPIGFEAFRRTAEFGAELVAPHATHHGSRGVQLHVPCAAIGLSTHLLWCLFFPHAESAGLARRRHDIGHGRDLLWPRSRQKRSPHLVPQGVPWANLHRWKAVQLFRYTAPRIAVHRL